MHHTVSSCGAVAGGRRSFAAAATQTEKLWSWTILMRDTYAFVTDCLLSLVRYMSRKRWLVSKNAWCETGLGWFVTVSSKKYKALTEGVFESECFSGYAPFFFKSNIRKTGIRISSHLTPLWSAQQRLLKNDQREPFPPKRLSMNQKHYRFQPKKESDHGSKFHQHRRPRKPLSMH